MGLNKCFTPTWAHVVIADLERYCGSYLDRPWGADPQLWSARLALRWLLHHHTPGTIWYGDCGPKTVVWFELTHSEATWTVRQGRVPDWIRSSLSDDVAVVGGSGPSLANHTTVYRVLQDEHWPFSADVSDLLQHRVEMQVRQWTESERQQWRVLGRRTWEISPYPEDVPPCPEIRGVGRWRLTDGARTLRVEDLIDDVEAVRVLECVPESVWGLLNRAAKLYTYGYMDWEFFTMAAHQAVMALETSLRALYVQQRADPMIIDVKNGRAVRHARPMSDRRPTYREVSTMVKSLQKRHRPAAVLVDGERFPATKAALAGWAKRHGWLSDSEELVLDHYFDLRDQWSHPESVDRRWIGDVYRCVYECAVLVNRMWVRAIEPAIPFWEHAYVDAPPWVIPSIEERIDF